MPKIVGILTFMRNINFVPSFEHEKSFMTLELVFVSLLVWLRNGKMCVRARACVCHSLACYI